MKFSKVFIASIVMVGVLSVSGAPIEVSAAPEISRPALLVQHNAQRAANGACSPLIEVAQLDQSAQAKAEDMAKNSYFAHVYNEKTPADWITETGYQWSRVGENLYYDNYGGSNAVNGWMSSPPHRANILGQFTQVGFGIVEVNGAYNGKAAENGPYVIVVAHFGTPSGVTAPSCPTAAPQPAAPVAPAPPTAPVSPTSTPPQISAAPSPAAPHSAPSVKNTTEISNTAQEDNINFDASFSKLTDSKEKVWSNVTPLDSKKIVLAKPKADLAPYVFGATVAVWLLSVAIYVRVSSRVLGKPSPLYHGATHSKPNHS